MAINDFKIFKANRLKLSELKEDVFSYLKQVYHTEGKEFTMASPFAQIVNVVLNFGRMILFYIESAITELNINTAFHERSIKGLATLTGHNPSRGIAARGSLYMSYNMTTDFAGDTITLNNYTKIRNTSNGLSYIAVLPGNTMQLTVGAYDSKIEIPIIQGTLKYQQATGSGLGLQSFNFANKSNELIDNFFVNIYVNGERWASVGSLLDMTYNQKACIVKSSINGGIDVFFGTGNMGMVPPEGASILCEYLVTSGSYGNITDNSDDNYWEFEDSGYDVNGDYVNLNDVYNLSSASEILFGTDDENIEITRQLAPHVSRAFVLANATNYKYFLTKLNMFSIIDAYSGFNTYEDMKIENELNDAKVNFASVKESYNVQVNLTGKDSPAALELYDTLMEAQTTLEQATSRYEDSKMDDNVIYLYLIPDVTKRIGDTENYFTCGIDKFKLTDDEKSGILNLIEDSGQKILTVDNRIVDPIFVRFAINVYVQIWNNFDFSSVKSSIISTVSDYLITNTRRDRIPVSDIIRIIEDLPGVDSVSVFFDADKVNENYYGKGNYGLDDYGDIVLHRNILDKLGNSVEVNDLLPLFRGPFVSSNDVEYSDELDSLTSPINITLRGKS